MLRIPLKNHQLSLFWGRATLIVSLACSLLLGSCGDEKTTPQGLFAECDLPWLLDQDGRVVIARGINVSASAKWSQHRVPDLDRRDLRRLRQDFGINALRLLVFWEAIEPKPGRYDEVYMATVASFIEEASHEGFLVVVDMHQDLYGRGFGQAGAPRWSCEEDYYESFEAPEEWWMGYLQPEVALCFDRLYQDENTRAAFLAAWAKLAEALRDTPGVWGYDLLNEPFWGSATATDFDTAIAPALYAELSDIIRSIHTDPWIGIEPAPTANLGVSSELKNPGRPRMVYMPHYYPKDVEVDGQYQGDSEALAKHMRTLCSDAQRLRTPLLVGEFGVRGATDGAPNYIRDFFDIADEARIGTFFWHLGTDGERGYGLMDKNEDASAHGVELARPYLARISGIPRGWAWYPEEDVFVAEWREVQSIGPPTVVALPRLAIAGKYKVTLQPRGPIDRKAASLEIKPVGEIRRLVIHATSSTKLTDEPVEENQTLTDL